MAKALCNRCKASAEGSTFEEASSKINHAAGLGRGIPCGKTYGCVVDISPKPTSLPKTPPTPKTTKGTVKNPKKTTLKDEIKEEIKDVVEDVLEDVVKDTEKGKSQAVNE
jgi:hypothetical protein